MKGEIKGWVEKEFGTLKMGSKRLERRFRIAMSNLSEQPEKSIWLATGSRANAQAVYRMLRNEKCTKESILSAHGDAVRERSAGNEVLLAVQDTMAVNYGTHEKTEGLGYNCEQTLGINVHNCLLLTPSGIPIGVVEQAVTTRKEKDSKGKSRQEKRKRPIEEKESYRWLETMTAAAERAPQGVKLIHIADREGDIYELYARAQKQKESFVIRMTHNRLTEDKTPVLPKLRATEAAGKTTVTIPANHGKKRKEREADMTVQYLCADILRPQIRQDSTDLEKTLRLTLVRLIEENPPEGIEAVEWILMTNLEIHTAQDAIQVAEYYKQRWKIERFHFVLKSGCNIEGIQQRSVEGIEQMILMYSIISVHIMQLTFLSRTMPTLPCDLLFSEIEWKTLYRAANFTRVEPPDPPTMEEAVLLVAKLAGRVGAKSDGPPGLKVVWIGLNKLFTLVAFRLVL